jgi:hypothetical protein
METASDSVRGAEHREYEPPCIEQVLSRDELSREVLYAGETRASEF